VYDAHIPYKEYKKLVSPYLRISLTILSSNPLVAWNISGSYLFILNMAWGLYSATGMPQNFWASWLTRTPNNILFLA